jgi:hypothetical protein
MDTGNAEPSEPSSPFDKGTTCGTAKLSKRTSESGLSDSMGTGFPLNTYLTHKYPNVRVGKDAECSATHASNATERAIATTKTNNNNSNNNNNNNNINNSKNNNNKNKRLTRKTSKRTRGGLAREWCAE